MEFCLLASGLHLLKHTVFEDAWAWGVSGGHLISIVVMACEVAIVTPLCAWHSIATTVAGIHRSGLRPLMEFTTCCWCIMLSTQDADLAVVYVCHQEFTGQQKTLLVHKPLYLKIWAALLAAHKSDNSTGPQCHQFQGKRPPKLVWTNSSPLQYCCAILLEVWTPTCFKL